MKKLLLLAVIFLTAASLKAQRKTNIDRDWHFYRGSAVNAEAIDYDDSHWRVLNLPHDWSVEPLGYQRKGAVVGPFSISSIGQWDTGETVGGEGWYRKIITFEPSDIDKTMLLHVEAAYNEAEVFLNGKKVHYSHYGYMPFKITIPDDVKRSGKALIAIRVVNEGLNSRWYAGSGLYRHVWIERMSKTHIDDWDTYIQAYIPGKLSKKTTKADAYINLYTKVFNDSPSEVSGKVVLTIGNGKTASQDFRVQGNSSADVAIRTTLNGARLWSIESPTMQTAKVEVFENGKKTDGLSIPFGVRQITVDANDGLRLNGERIKLKGACVHHDNGLLGAASLDRAEIHKVEQLKSLGYNAVRCSHNLPAVRFLDACDSLGLLVIDEVFDQWLRPKRDQDYHLKFRRFASEDMALMIRRDRNHPSIIIWSIGNEIPGRIDPEGMEAAEMLRNVICKFDPLPTDIAKPQTNQQNYAFRPIMSAICSWDYKRTSWDEQTSKAFKSLDIGGYNYMLNKYEKDHEQYPDRIIVGSESYPQDVVKVWNLTDKHNYIIGDFVWTALDYVGEAGLANNIETNGNTGNQQFMGWPWFNAWCGDLDLCGFKKPQSYLRDIVWGLSDIALAVRPTLPEGYKEKYTGWGWRQEENHWTWTGKEGHDMTVRVYSKAPKVRLSLNGKIIGEQSINPETLEAIFYMPYEPGTLKAENIGKDRSSISYATAGMPEKIRIDIDRSTISSNHNDLAYASISILDGNGNLCPTADVKLKIESNGAKATLLGGNGSPTDMASFRSLNPKTFRGHALVIVNPQNEAGEITLKVSAEGLEDATAVIKFSTQ